MKRYLAAAFMLLSMQAQADDFTFSFTSTNGAVPGTVSGTIYGLSSSGESAATDIKITSVTAAQSTEVTLPYDIFAATSNTPMYNSFIVENGQIVGGGFYVLYNDSAVLLALNYYSISFYLNGFEPGGTNTSAYNTDGMEGLTYTLVTSPDNTGGNGGGGGNTNDVPEPISLSLLGTGLFAAAAIRLSRILFGDRSARS